MRPWKDLSRSLKAVPYGRSVIIGIFLLVSPARSSDARETGIGILFEGDHRLRLTLLWHDGPRLASHFFRVMSRE